MTNKEKVIDGQKEIIMYLLHMSAMCNEDVESYYDELRNYAVNTWVLLENLLKEQEPPKCGRWVRLTGMAPPEYHGHKICSVCGCLAPYDPIHPWREELSRYCPGCGAEMEGEVE